LMLKDKQQKKNPISFFGDRVYVELTN